MIRIEITEREEGWGLFKFKGKWSNTFPITVNKIQRSILPTITRNLIYIPGMEGAYPQDTVVGVSMVKVQVTIIKENMTDLSNSIKEISSWLYSEEPEEFVLQKDPNLTIYAMLDGTTELDEIITVGEGTLTFICPDPYKYGQEDDVFFQNAATFSVDGSVETDPVITVKLKQATTFVSLYNGEELNMIGMPAREEQDPFEPETKVFGSDGDNLTGWTTSNNSDISPNTGTLKTNGSGFYSDNYGVSTGWHGPAMKTSFGSTVTDFRFDVGLVLQSTGANQAGGIEVALLDANSITVAKIAMIKHFGELNSFYARVRAGTSTNGHDVMPEGGSSIFYGDLVQGVFRVYRTGNQWIAQFFQILNGLFQSPTTFNWTDNEGIATESVAQVQVQLLQRGDFPVVNQYVDDIDLYRKNDPAANQVPYIGKAGDIIVFDHKNHIIRRNGFDFTKEKAFIGDYFSLKPGQNTLVVEPAIAIEDVHVRWNPKWR